MCMHVHTQNTGLLKNNYSSPMAGTILNTFHALSHFIFKIILWVGYCYFFCFTDGEGKALGGEGTCQRSDEASKQSSRRLHGGGPAPSTCPPYATALCPSPSRVVAHFLKALEPSILYRDVHGANPCKSPAATLVNEAALVSKVPAQGHSPLTPHRQGTEWLDHYLFSP